MFSVASPQLTVSVRLKGRLDKTLSFLCLKKLLPFPATRESKAGSVAIRREHCVLQARLHLDVCVTGASGLPSGVLGRTPPAPLLPWLDSGLTHGGPCGLGQCVCAAAVSRKLAGPRAAWAVGL